MQTTLSRERIQELSKKVLRLFVTQKPLGKTYRGNRASIGLGVVIWHRPRGKHIWLQSHQAASEESYVKGQSTSNLPIMLHSLVSITLSQSIK